MSNIKAALFNPHTKAQALRFARLVVTALIASGIVDKAMHGGVDRTAIIAAVIGAVEVAVRQFRQVTPKA